MAKYLDYSGLQYLWTKIKNYVSTQPLGANVRYDAQTLTTAQQEQARKNVGAANTNPNLLDNSWWGSNEVVNQRNTTSAPSYNGLYTIDRWIWTTGATGNTWGIDATGITFTIVSNSVWYSQKNPNPSAINGKTVTASALLSDGTIYSGSATFSSGTAAVLYDSTPLRIYLDTGGNFTLRISSTMTVRAVKLELGNVSTLQYDTPPDYGEELTRCIYSKADPTDTYANNGFGRTNPNLLDNPWFTVRQRGDGPFSGANTFAMDRWRVTSNSTITCTTNGITITTTTKKWGMQYRVTKDFFTVGKTYTISALEQDGTITNATFTWTGSGVSLYPIGSNVGFEVSTSNGSYNIIYFTTSEVGSVYLRAVKLELGSVSTLANDVPPKEEQATADCKWYFQRIQQEDGYTAPVGFGIVAASTTILRTLIPLSSPLRKAGTLTATATNIGQMRVQGNGSSLTPTAITGRGVLNGNAIVDITVDGTLANNQFYTLVFVNSTAIIDLSKDL